MTVIHSSLLDFAPGTMLTGSGKIFSLNEPAVGMVDIEDIANSLSKTCRWNGNIPEFYSVAQHSCLVAWLAPERLAFAALLHDAAETYTGDIIRPVKKMLAQTFYDIEHRIELTICNKFGFPREFLSLVSKYDDQALELEYNAFYKQDNAALTQICYLSAMRLNQTPAFPMWDPTDAKYYYLETFTKIKKMIHV